MANQRLQLTFDGETYTIAKRMGGPDWYVVTGPMERFCEDLAAWLVWAPRLLDDHGSQAIKMHYEHGPEDWLDPPLSAAQPTYPDGLCPTCGKDDAT